MSVLRYAVNELLFRSGRSLVTAVSIALAVLAAIVLTSLAASYARALRVPIETVGADVIVQQQGDIPPKLEGLVFPHPNALIPADIVRADQGDPRRHLADARRLHVGPRAGPLRVGARHRRRRGRPCRTRPTPDRRQADHRREPKPSWSTAITPARTTSKSATASRSAPTRSRSPASSMPRAAASWCAPTSICRCRWRKALATAAPQVRALYPFGADDANLVLVKVNREQLQGVVETVTNLDRQKGRGVERTVDAQRAVRRAVPVAEHGADHRRHHRPVRRRFRLARDRDLGCRAPPRNGDPAGDRLVVAAHRRAGDDRESGARGDRHRGRVLPSRLSSCSRSATSR